MTERYYLLDSAINISNYKETKPIDIADIDTDQYLDCQKSPYVGISQNQYGANEEFTLVLYSKMPFSAESEIDDMLDAKKFLTDLNIIYKSMSIKKEYVGGMIYYMIGIDKVDQ